MLDFSAGEAAELLELSVASVNSALQRARATLRERPRRPAAQEPDESLLRRYVETTERSDVNGLAALLRDDVRWSMPPEPGTFAGRDAVVRACVEGGFGTAAFGDFRCVVTSANRMPAVACYLRKPGETAFRPLALDVLEIGEDGLIAEIVTFALEGRVEAFGLPEVL